LERMAELGKKGEQPKKSLADIQTIGLQIWLSKWLNRIPSIVLSEQKMIAILHTDWRNARESIQMNPQMAHQNHQVKVAKDVSGSEQCQRAI
jgi:hypothetical protein